MKMISLIELYRILTEFRIEYGILNEKFKIGIKFRNDIGILKVESLDGEGS